MEDLELKTLLNTLMASQANLTEEVHKLSMKVDQLLSVRESVPVKTEAQTTVAYSNYQQVPAQYNYPGQKPTVYCYDGTNYVTNTNE
jgi:DNA-binding protein H-NS